MFCVADGVRPEARSVISELAREGCVIVMLTGDGDGAAKAVAREVGVPDDCVYSKCLPEDKLEYVSSMIKRTIQTETPLVKQELLLFVGDGVNGMFRIFAYFDIILLTCFCLT
jgi:P-type E1-E2 ATPase